jgi:DNA uptake protein ComE-like DNA-binding protein
MATPGEKKALLFFGIVAMLGAGVRVWQARRPASAPPSADTYKDDSARSGSSRSVRATGSRITPVRKGAGASRTGHINRDSNSIVDLDRATMSEIDALGVAPKGTARLIVADRDSFGPFGSLDELRRVPFLSASTLRKLAPRVTFSRVPRPRNTVVNPRAFPVISTGRRNAGARP